MDTGAYHRLMTVRGPYAKSTRTREQILTAALETISKGGYAGASLQQIADAVGMTKAGLLHHFESREALFTAVLNRRDEIDTEGIVAGDQIDEFVHLMQRNADVPGLVALFSAITGVGAAQPIGSTTRTFTETHYARIIPLLTGAIEERQREGKVSSSRSAVNLARLLVAAADGLQTQWLLDPDIDMRAELAILIDAFES